MVRALWVDAILVYGDAFITPAPVRARPDLGRSIAIAVFAAVLMIAGGTAFIASGSAQSWNPNKWDPRIAPIAAEVAKLRGLNFEHPVPIKYLAPKEFEKELGADDLSPAERTEIEREGAVFRALGLMSGRDDLLAGYTTSQSSAVLAYYDPDQQDIIVRGTTLDVEHRVTIAHELTHVLQDQHFDLRSLQARARVSTNGDSWALKALVEGDAVRIEQDYLAQLPSDDFMKYLSEDADEGARVGKETASVPEIVDIESGAPYEFGPSSIRVLLASGGNAAVNDALTGPTPGTGLFIEPGDVTPPVAVERPLTPSGAVVRSTEVFGAFETYLTLAMRIDPLRALRAADVVGGGHAVTYLNGGSTCYRVRLAPASEGSRDFLLSAVQAWAHERPGTTVDAAGDEVGFTACDQGKSTPGPSSARFHTTIDLLEMRTTLTVNAAKGHVSAAVARCVGRVSMTAPGAEQLALQIENGAATAAQIATLRKIAAQSAGPCRADPESGLP